MITWLIHQTARCREVDLGPRIGGVSAVLAPHRRRAEGARRLVGGHRLAWVRRSSGSAPVLWIGRLSGLVLPLSRFWRGAAPLRSGRHPCLMRSGSLHRSCRHSCLMQGRGFRRSCQHPCLVWSRSIQRSTATIARPGLTRVGHTVGRRAGVAEEARPGWIGLDGLVLFDLVERSHAGLVVGLLGGCRPRHRERWFGPRLVACRRPGSMLACGCASLRGIRRRFRLMAAPTGPANARSILKVARRRTIRRDALIPRRSSLHQSRLRGRLNVGTPWGIAGCGCGGRVGSPSRGGHGRWSLGGSVAFGGRVGSRSGVVDCRAGARPGNRRLGEAGGRLGGRRRRLGCGGLVRLGCGRLAPLGVAGPLSFGPARVSSHRSSRSRGRSGRTDLGVRIDVDHPGLDQVWAPVLPLDVGWAAGEGRRLGQGGPTEWSTGVWHLPCLGSATR
jgi:hypothetical protein